jgi:hypothetical protein
VPSKRLLISLVYLTIKIQSVWGSLLMGTRPIGIGTLDLPTYTASEPTRYTGIRNYINYINYCVNSYGDCEKQYILR